MVHLENYDLTAVAEAWWDDSHNWNTAFEGYEICRTDDRRYEEG